MELNKKGGAGEESNGGREVCVGIRRQRTLSRIWMQSDERARPRRVQVCGAIKKVAPERGASNDPPAK
jgi:hypothetical protein